jgi:hypothetical protein
MHPILVRVLASAGTTLVLFVLLAVARRRLSGEEFGIAVLLGLVAGVAMIVGFPPASSDS